MPIFSTLKFWLIAIPAAILITTITLYVHGAEKAKGQKAVLETQVRNLTADLAGRDQTITDLRGSRDMVNTRLAEMIAGNNAAIDAEVERRRQVAIERDKAKAALRIALDTIRTESENDAEFAHWLDQPVPAAAWERLRAAAE